MHSLRFKITAITVAGIVTALLLVFLVAIFTVQDQTDRSSVETMDLIGRNTAQSMEKYTEGIEQSIDMIGNFATSSLDSVALVKGGVAGSVANQSSQTPEQAAQLDAYLAEYCTNIQEISSAVASHTQGIIAYYYCINPQVSSAMHGFCYSNVGKTGFYEQPPIDARQLDPDDREHTTWYYTTIERGRPSWVGPYTDSFQNEMWTYSYIVPIYKAGALIGVLGMDIPLDMLIEQVSAIKVYDTGFACLLDEDGRVIYHPNVPFGSTPEMSIDLNIFKQKDSGDQLIRYTTNGEERRISFTTMSNGLKLAIVAPTSEVNTSLTQLTRIIVPVAAIIVIIAVILSLLLVRHITTPLLRLTAASQRLADADYDVELDYDSRDEVGALTNSFQRMRDQLKENIEDLNRKALTDNLTGLPNQRHFYDLAEMERRRLLDEGKQPIILYFNLVGLKHFNRQYGFEEGDRLICAVADLLARRFGEQNTGRFGQDHFAVVTGSDNLEGRLRTIFDECRSINNGVTLPLSVGIYHLDQSTDSANVACDRAKFACDKRRGSYVSGFCHFDKVMQSAIETERYVIDHLDQALEEQWIQVYYQPIVRATTSMVCDEEALARWIDPIRGFLSPADFIPTLESAGLVYKLDLFMLDQILHDMQYLQEQGHTVVSHSVNLSRSDFESCDIVEEIRKRVDAAGIPRNKISVEITESIIGRDFDFMKTQIERFQALGFPVWMDDFGSGYSSLEVLKYIQFDLIKFDMSFTRNLDQSENGKIVLTEMMKMATSLGVDTICEGIETEEQHRFLQEIGCSKLQGFLFSKPLPFSEMLERHHAGLQLGFENPREASYHEAISRLSLYDLTSVASQDEGPLQNTFDTLPMAIMEVQGADVRLVRSNKSFRDFSLQMFNLDASAQTVDLGDALFASASPLGRAIRECCDKGMRTFFDDQLPDGTIAHSFIRRISKNDVTGATAVALAVLSVAEPDESATYAAIARALARDYYNIYYVDLDTGHFIEYRSPVGEEELVKERHGDHFFEETEKDTKRRMYGEDREAFLAAFTKENILRELDERDVFTATYRLVDMGEPMRVNMKVTRMEPGAHRVIMGISIV